ncbi:hypothetical protein [Phenylobacterium ferrooxidans]|uniref:Uncharacterized protein n=1 Tax=Phenylobacterium ferrooxidans TaxID=2982689 RepID=A0ABW6CMR4_9CAUL
MPLVEFVTYSLVLGPGRLDNRQDEADARAEMGQGINGQQE